MTASGADMGRWGRIAARWDRVPGNVRGAVWMLASSLSFVCGQAIAKTMSDTIPSYELTFFRCAVTFLLAFPMVMRGGRAAFRTSRFPMHLCRGIAGGLAMLCIFYGITRLPLADVNTIGFARPLFMILLAVLFLGEAVNVRRWAATAAGFIGVLLVLRPGVGTFEPAAYVVLGAAMFYSIAHVFLKKLTASENPATIVFYYMMVAATVALVPSVFVWVWPTPFQLLLLCIFGSFTALGQTFLTISFRAGDATVVSPFDYSRLIWSGLFDMAVFAVFPDAWTIAGAVIIVLSTLYIGQRGAREARAAKAGRSDG